MKMVRFGIIGTGFMGGNHAAWLHAGNISGACLTAVCDIAPARLDWARQTFGDEVAIYQDYHELLVQRQGGCRTHRYTALPASGHRNRRAGGWTAYACGKACRRIHAKSP